MFNALFLLTLFPSWLVAMGLLYLLRRRQLEIENKKALLPVPVEQTTRR